MRSLTQISPLKPCPHKVYEPELTISHFVHWRVHRVTTRQLESSCILGISRDESAVSGSLRANTSGNGRWGNTDGEGPANPSEADFARRENSLPVYCIEQDNLVLCKSRPTCLCLRQLREVSFRYSVRSKADGHRLHVYARHWAWGTSSKYLR